MTLMGKADLNYAVRQLQEQPASELNLVLDDGCAVERIVGMSERYITANTSLISGHQTRISRFGAHSPNAASTVLLQLRQLASQRYSDVPKAAMRDHAGNKALRVLPPFETVLSLLSSGQPQRQGRAMAQATTKLWASLDNFATAFGGKRECAGGARCEVTASSISCAVQCCMELLLRERYELRAVETTHLMEYMYASAAASITAMLLIAERALTCPLQVEHDLLTVFCYQQLVALATGQTRCMLQEQCRGRLNGCALWCAPQSAFSVMQPAGSETDKGAPWTLGLKPTTEVEKRWKVIKCGLLPYAASPEVGHGVAARASAHQRTLVALMELSRVHINDRDRAFADEFIKLFQQSFGHNMKAEGRFLGKPEEFRLRKVFLEQEDMFDELPSVSTTSNNQTRELTVTSMGHWIRTVKQLARNCEKPMVWCHAMFFNAELGRRLATQSNVHLPGEIEIVLLRACIDAFFRQGLDVLGYSGHRGTEDVRAGRGPQLQKNMMRFRLYTRAAPHTSMFAHQQRGHGQGGVGSTGAARGRDDMRSGQLHRTAGEGGAGGAGEGNVSSEENQRQDNDFEFGNGYDGNLPSEREDEEALPSHNSAGCADGRPPPPKRQRLRRAGADAEANPNEAAAPPEGPEPPHRASRAGLHREDGEPPHEAPNHNAGPGIGPGTGTLVSSAERRGHHAGARLDTRSTARSSNAAAPAAALERPNDALGRRCQGGQRTPWEPLEWHAVNLLGAKPWEHEGFHFRFAQLSVGAAGKCALAGQVLLSARMPTRSAADPALSLGPQHDAAECTWMYVEIIVTL
eukprot:TRINITY_DN2168_c0_g1_i9.p1 TRINITY_DN2168_c0_g1~~TRINITY_DN2168_c0_g1_i9.p1  ORF type:complete len:804 (-),score=113.16 TRINITY_DN2168_c0_g1_i9:753-3164(-)